MMVMVKKFPKDKGLDHTVDLIREGYLFIENRADYYATDIFQTRLMGKKVVCMTGAVCAKMFYNPRLFERKNVMPRRVKETLIGKGGVQGLDGKAHEERKAFFIHLVNEKQEEELIRLATKIWEKTIKTWPDKKEIILFDEAKKVLCQAACEWVGIPDLLPAKQVKKAADALEAMIFGFGRIGVTHWKGRISRNQLESSLKDTIEGIRNDRVTVKSGTILEEISHYRDEKGNLLESEVAAVELLNLIRPIVAVAVYITFAAVALYENPAYKVKIALDDDEGEKVRFNEEVSRYYPFAPFIGAKVKKNFIWRNYAFKRGTLVLLDLYGTNHDKRLWKDPFTFNPERYKKERKSAYNFMPQGGGSTKGHRCVGEHITLAMMNVALDVLTKKISYELPPQDLSYSISTIPTIIRSGVIMKNIKEI